MYNKVMLEVKKEALLNAIKVCEKATAKNAPYRQELSSILFEYNKENTTPCVNGRLPVAPCGG